MKTIDPDPTRFQEAISAIPKGVPVVMLNLLKFRETALYPDGASDISGREAYGLYSEQAIKHLKDIGGKPIWMGKAHAAVIGPPEEDWDEVLLIKYPSIEKFLEMVMSPSYQDCVIHRTAALEDSRLIATVEQAGLQDQ